MSGHLLVRRPSPALADGELTHLDRAPVDADLALRQWQGYVEAFAGPRLDGAGDRAGRRAPGRGVRGGHAWWCSATLRC